MLRSLFAFAFAFLLLCCAPLTHARAQAALLIEARLAGGPHPPADAPDVVVHVPAGYDAQRPLHIVVFLHGFDGCARALIAAAKVPCRTGEPPHRVWNLAGLHEQAGTNTILLVPQLAYLARTAKGHRFVKHGAFDAMLHELLGAQLIEVLGRRDVAQIRTVTLVAHSAGYAATSAILRDPKRKAPVEHVVLLDALYAGFNVFADWAKQAQSHRLISLYTAQAQTSAGNRALQRALRAHHPLLQIDGKVEDALQTHPLVIARVTTAHGDMPRVHFAEVLRGLPALSPSPTPVKTAH